MANLPSNTFLCNYNAKTFDSATTTILKTQGQLFDQDLVLSEYIYWPGFPPSITQHLEDGYITIKRNNYFTGGYYFKYDFGSTGNNPFNRYDNETGRSLTLIYKTSSGFGGNDSTLLANRFNADNYNFCVRQSHILGNTDYMEFTPTESPVITYVRVYNDGYAERKCVTTNQIVTSTTFTYGNRCQGVGFFCGDGSSLFNNEFFHGDFYWLYVSNETLTDNEIAKVIAYNEGTSVFKITPSATTASYEASSYTVSLEAEEEMSWTATTIPSWVSLSSTAGTGSTAITVSVSKNSGVQRTGTIVFTNSENDTAEVAITQDNHPLIIPNNNIYRGGILIN